MNDLHSLAMCSEISNCKQEELVNLLAKRPTHSEQERIRKQFHIECIRALFGVHSCIASLVVCATSKDESWGSDLEIAVETLFSLKTISLQLAMAEMMFSTLFMSKSDLSSHFPIPDEGNSQYSDMLIHDREKSIGISLR